MDRTLSQPQLRIRSASPRIAPIRKKLIVCCDGTWMNRDNGWVRGSWGNPGHPQAPSNVTRIARAIRDIDDNLHQQIVYYQAGIGTSFSVWENIIGGGTGSGLAENVREAYSFLANNYSEHGESGITKPDSVFLIGFSRGAFTARSIGALIGDIGILRKEVMPFFYEIYQDWQNAGNARYKPQFFDNWFKYKKDLQSSKPSDELARDYKRISEYLEAYRELLRDLKLTRDAHIRCIGVWDTVGSLGIPINPLFQTIAPFLPAYISRYQWVDTKIGTHVQNAFHALALDERRYPYSPSVWERPKGSSTNLEQVWFPGSHANVGGGYEDQGMANMTLIWMMDQLAGHSAPDPGAGPNSLAFDDRYIDDYNDLQVEQYTRGTVEARRYTSGAIYDSLTFPQSLAGSKVRTPGRYCLVDNLGRRDVANPLLNTNEKVHFSVRLLLDTEHPGIQPDWSQAFPWGWNVKPWFELAWQRLTGCRPKYLPHREALKGWRLVDSLQSQHHPGASIISEPTKLSWVYKGANAEAVPPMPEDELGPWEMRFLARVGRPDEAANRPLPRSRTF